MKAIFRDHYGPPETLELREVETPVPGDGEILIEVAAASLNRSDWETMLGRPLYARLEGPFRPRQHVLGSDVSGRVVKVGDAVSSLRVGDEVFGDVMYHGASTFAEYVCVPESAPLALKPESIGFAEAATLPQAGLIALQGISEKVSAGDRVLVNGAGGGTGVFAIQLAKAAGAEVTGVDNEWKQELILSVGADNALDYTVADYTKLGTGFDFILDLVCQRSMFAIRRAVAPGGRYRVVGGSTRALLAAVTLGRLLSTGGRSIGVLMVKPNKQDMARVGEMAVTGSLRPSIERSYSLEEVPDALRHLGDGRALGKLVVEMS